MTRWLHRQTGTNQSQGMELPTIHSAVLNCNMPRNGSARDRRRIYVCGEWEVDLTRRELRARGLPVPIGDRALQIIEMLVQSAGELVTKDDLIAFAWSGAVVEDNTIQVHISQIRKVLGTDRDKLKTVWGRGYRLLGSWDIKPDSSPIEAAATQRGPMGHQICRTIVADAAMPLIGREAPVQELQDLLSNYRIVTLTGPGGIGKTVLAAEVVRLISPAIERSVAFVELASVSDPNQVPSRVMSTLGRQLGGNQISPKSVARAIGGDGLLLVLDNCEHVLGAAASLAETLVRSCPNATVLATSREFLRIEGEYVYHVPALEFPSVHEREAARVLGHSAVQLLVARITALRSNFRPHGENLAAVASICRHLDGIPLALEFAANPSAALGVHQVAALLGDRFALLKGGRRTAPPRHQSLRATLDWSYELLSERERRLLRRLAIFPAPFTLEAATPVVGDADSVVADGVASLVSKSLLILDGSASHRRWRMLETIRAYAQEKLSASGDVPASALNACHYQDRLRAREAD
jgi:non-specific serine/threonine protein kinase